MKEYYLNEIKKVLDANEPFFKIKIKGLMSDVETKTLTLPIEVLIVLYNTLNSDVDLK